MRTLTRVFEAALVGLAVVAFIQAAAPHGFIA